MEKKRFIHLYRLLPNMLTLLAICLGITSIRYALVGRFEIATILVIFAVFLDGIDGRVARFFGSSSAFGAHLDSLADVANFGVSPAIIVYLWSLSNIPFRGVGWGAVLIYVICGILRLARFNVTNTEHIDRHAFNSGYSEIEKNIIKHKRNFFVGLPIPSAAVLILVPMISTFKIFPEYNFEPIAIALYTVCISLMMVSSIPVFGGKYVKISPKVVPFVVVLIWIIAGSLVMLPWFAIPILTVVYMFSILFGCLYYHLRLKDLQKMKKAIVLNEKNSNAQRYQSYRRSISPDDQKNFRKFRYRKNYKNYYINKDHI